MALDIRTLVALNITVQIILALVLAGSIYLAKKRSLKRHCAVMRITVPVQILAILGIMLPAMSGSLNRPADSAVFVWEVLIHHALGLGVVVFWIYINLVFLRYVKPFLRIRPTMQMAAAFWIISLILGVHIYSQLYITNSGGSILPDPQENATATIEKISQQDTSGRDSLPVMQKQTISVDIKNFIFNPNAITVIAGTTVIWTNHDATPHTVTSTSSIFDSGVMDEGENFSYTFQDPGTYDYYCMVHPYMKARVIATSSDDQLDVIEVSRAEANQQPVSLAEPGSEISIVPVSTTSPQPSTRVTVDLLAKNMNFDKDEITVIAGSKVFINFVNLDVGMPHNFAVYTGSDATSTIFQGRVVDGPAKITYAFDAPVDTGTYFFRCDVHPKVMTGQFYVVSSDLLESTQTMEARQSQPEMDMTGPGAAAAMSEGNAQNQSAAAPQSVTVDLVAENIAFDRSTITVPAGAKVTVNLNNRDSGVPHNFAVYETEAAEKIIFRGQIVTGLAKTEYTFDSPAVPGTYFFRCDIHPTLMKGQLIVE